MEQEFTVLKDFPKYAINNKGQLKNIKKDTILKPWSNKGGYLQVTFHKDGIRYDPYVHKLVAETFLINNNEENNVVDHIDGNKTNNAVENLRYCTQRQNCMNSKKRLSPATSQYKGVYYDKSGNRYRATITIDGVRIHLGSFKSELAARNERIKAVNKAFGEFCHISEKLVS